MAVVLAYRGLPTAAPGGSSRRNHHLIDGPSTSRAGIDERSADESRLRMIEMIRIELIDGSPPCRAPSDEWVDVEILTEVGGGIRTHLEGVVLAHDAFLCGRIVRDTDLREQQQTHVMHLERRKNDQRGWLFNFTSAFIDVENTPCDLARVIEQDFGDVGVRADFQIGAAFQD